LILWSGILRIGGEQLTKEFSETKFQTFGFLGAFGRKKWLWGICDKGCESTFIDGRRACHTKRMSV
jgi:hypothetical protein